MSFKQFTVQRQLRYTMFPEQPEKGKHLLVALHGYGQLVEFFAKKFQHLGEQFVVVCPEGMHRFYLEGTSGRVGASWMTREWREQDIQENITSLNQLIGFIVEHTAPSKISVLGFSQGVATAARWMNSTDLKIDQFIAWAGVFPPDLPMDSKLRFPDERTAVVGTNDPYFKDEHLTQMLELYERIGFQVISFDGKHELQEDLIRQLLA